jgi:release factor family 10
MLTREALTSLLQSLEGRHVLSVYIDGRAPDPAGRRGWRAGLTKSLTALRHTLANGKPAELAEFDRCEARLRTLVDPKPGALRAQGWVAFVTEDTVALAEDLPVAMPNVARWTMGPWVSPYIRAQKELRAVILAVVDARSARTFRYAEGALTPLIRIHAHARIDEPSHMGAAPRASFHTGTRGATASEVVERSRQEATHHMLRELVDHILQLAASDSWILIGGMPNTADLAMAMLPQNVHARTGRVARLNQLTPPAELRRAASAGARKLRRALDDQIVDAVISQASGHGRGAIGESATRHALWSDAVHVLLLTTRFLAERPDATEEMTRRALASGASVEIVAGEAADRLDNAGGIGGALRFHAAAESSEETSSAATDLVARP